MLKRAVCVSLGLADAAWAAQPWGGAHRGAIRLANTALQFAGAQAAAGRQRGQGGGGAEVLDCKRPAKHARVY